MAVVDTEPCLHCQITDLLDQAVERERAENLRRRESMSAVERFIDERWEQAQIDAAGQVGHWAIYGEYYAPAGGPGAFVGQVRPQRCFCGRRDD